METIVVLAVSWLSARSTSPKMQLLGVCEFLDGFSRERVLPELPPLPFDIVVADNCVRMAVQPEGPPGLRGVHIITSDECATFLFSLQPVWSIRILESISKINVPSLLHFQVTAAMPPFVRPAAVPKARPARRDDVPSEFDFDDPFAFGAAAVPPLPPPPTPPVAGDLAADLSEDDASLPPDVVDDVLDCFEAELVDIAAVAAPASPAPATPPIVAGAGDEHIDEIDACRRWEAYYMARLCAPRKNVSMRCYMHTKCSIAKMRKNVDNETLMKWLFYATPCPGATAEERAKRRSEHLEEYVRLTSGGSSSSASGSGAAAAHPTSST